MKLSANRRTATGGILGGMLDADELAADLDIALRQRDAGEGCGHGNDSYFWRSFAEMRADGTIDQVCDAVSIGAWFEAKAVTLGGVAPPRAYDACRGWVY